VMKAITYVMKIISYVVGNYYVHNESYLVRGFSISEEENIHNKSITY
jgi:hypothetical protein